MVKSCEVSAPWPLHGAGSNGSMPRQEQAEPRDGQRHCGVPGEQSITHLRAEGAMKPGSWVPTLHLKPHPDLREQPPGAGGKSNKSLFWGLPVLACQG